MVVSYRVKRYTKHGERELLSGMMFPQAAPNTTFKSLLVSLSTGARRCTKRKESHRRCSLKVFVGNATTNTPHKRAKKQNIE